MSHKTDPAPVDTGEATREDASPDPSAADAAGGEALLELVLAEHVARAAAAPPSRIDGVLVGRLAAIEPDGGPRVDFVGAPPGGVVARSMIAVDAAQIDHEVALLFEGGDPRRPLVMGMMFRPAAPIADAPTEESPAPTAAPPIALTKTVENDGERIVFEADKEIVLRCGQASITLTRAGKILIRGAYVLTRSSGVNRIQGGSVQIN